MVAHNYGSWRLILLATTVRALVVGTLQSGILICLPYALAILARPYRHGHYNWRRLFGLQTVVSLLLFAGLCVLLYPQIVGEYGSVIAGYLAGQTSEFNLGGGSHEFHLSMFSVENLPQFVFRLSSYQPFLTAAIPIALVYFVVSLRHRRLLLLICLPFPLINLMIWGMFFGTFPRITASLVPYMIFAVAYAVEDISCKLARRWTLRSGRWQLFIFALILLPAMLSSSRLVWVTAQTDTRSLVSQWINESIAAEQAILLNFQLFDLLPTAEAVNRQGSDFPGSVGTR